MKANIPPWLCWLIGILTIIPLSIDSGRQFYLENKLYNQIEIVADTNNDNRTSVDEWAEVYKKLGIYFNDLDPKDLTIKEMQKYLSRNN